MASEQRETLAAAIGGRIRAIRTRKKLSLEDVARRIEQRSALRLNRQQLSKIELGSRRTSVEQYQAIADALEVQRRTLLG